MGKNNEDSGVVGEEERVVLRSKRLFINEASWYDNCSFFFYNCPTIVLICYLNNFVMKNQTKTVTFLYLDRRLVVSTLWTLFHINA